MVNNGFVHIYIHIAVVYIHAASDIPVFTMELMHSLYIVFYAEILLFFSVSLQRIDRRCFSLFRPFTWEISIRLWLLWWIHFSIQIYHASTNHLCYSSEIVRYYNLFCMKSQQRRSLSSSSSNLRLLWRVSMFEFVISEITFEWHFPSQWWHLNENYKNSNITQLYQSSSYRYSCGWQFIRYSIVKWK